MHVTLRGPTGEGQGTAMIYATTLAGAAVPGAAYCRGTDARTGKSEGEATAADGPSAVTHTVTPPTNDTAAGEGVGDAEIEDDGAACEGTPGHVKP